MHFTIGGWKLVVMPLVIPSLLALTTHKRDHGTLRPATEQATPNPCKPGAGLCIWTDANGVTHSRIDDSGMGPTPKG